MILPITVYGNPVLRKETEDIDQNYPNLPTLIANMFETMYNADGVGLAAPQVGLNIRLFVIDLSVLEDEHPEYKDYKRIMINPEILEFFGEDTSMEEGCLSVPGISEKVIRKDSIKINYLDENFIEHEEIYTGYPARVIQHEYDHLEGHLFVDHVAGIRKQLIRGKLTKISSGKISCRYRIKN